MRLFLASMLIGLLAIPALFPAGAVADAPNVMTYAIDEGPTDEAYLSELCGFPITWRATGFVSVRSFDPDF